MVGTGSPAPSGAARTVNVPLTSPDPIVLTFRLRGRSALAQDC